MYTVCQASRAYVSWVAAEADAGRATRQDCASVILYTAERATQVALDAIQVSGLAVVRCTSRCAGKKVQSTCGSQVCATLAVVPPPPSRLFEIASNSPRVNWC
jgi:alkylation response protein AidB-like acyl-CoA dehydrogenase